jgi:hypothetical protein
MIKQLRELERSLQINIRLGELMTDKQQYVADLIRTAFRDVTLGNGVGLLQGQAIDDFADAETIATSRKKDETKDWSRISISDLVNYASSLSFFDAEGMRFHLPAYIIADLDGKLKGPDVLFALTYFGYDNMSSFGSLNDLQRNAIREFLLLRLEENHDDDYFRPIIEKALSDYWSRSHIK